MRRLVGALAAATCRSFAKSGFAYALQFNLGQDGRRQAAAGQSADKAAHSKEMLLAGAPWESSSSVELIV